MKNDKNKYRLMQCELPFFAHMTAKQGNLDSDRILTHVPRPMAGVAVQGKPDLQSDLTPSSETTYFKVVYRRNQSWYTATNFPSYDLLERHHISGLTRDRYESVKRRYVGTAIPLRDPDILYPEEPEKEGLLSWADHQIAEVITYNL